MLTPLELWEATGRAGIPELFRITDRAGRKFLLPLTHEETFTFHAREIQSYKQLPQAWYHFQTKDRDEPRPRSGLIRVREFIMKDSYSFDRDEEGLEVSFRAHWGAYHKIFQRAALEFFEVQAESGMMGGSESMDFLAPSARARTRSSRARTATSRPTWRSPARCRARPSSRGSMRREEIETPGSPRSRRSPSFLGIDPAATSKAMPVVKDDGTVVLALVRGDDRLELAKLAAAVGENIRQATEDEIKAAFGADPGSLGPVGFEGDVIADDTLREGQFVAGANRTGRHLRGVEAGRDFEPRFADIRIPQEGDRCPACGGELEFRTAIEVGHIFKLGTKYSVPLQATFLDEDGKEKPLVMGSYGIGLGRVMAAAVEQNHDERGIIWPPSIAPYDVHVVALPGVEQQAEEAANELALGGHEVLLDDREQRAGREVRGRRPDRHPRRGSPLARRPSMTGWSICGTAPAVPIGVSRFPS